MARSPLQIELDEPTLCIGDELSGVVEVVGGEGINQVDLELGWKREGAGIDVSETVASTRIHTGTQAVGGSFPFRLPVSEGPHSHPGTLFSVSWELRAKGARPGRDAHVVLPVQVAPAGGVVPAPPGSEPRVIEPYGPDTLVERRHDRPPEPEAEVSLGAALLAAALYWCAVAYGGWMYLEYLRVEDVLTSYSLGMGGVALLGLLVLFVLVVRQQMARSVLGPVEVEFDPFVARPGQPVEVLVRFHPRRDGVLEGVLVRLRCVEEMDIVLQHRNRVSTSKETERVRIEARSAEGLAFQAGRPEELRIRLPLPEDVPVPLSAGAYHSVKWLRKVTLRLRGHPSWASDEVRLPLAWGGGSEVGPTSSG